MGFLALTSHPFSISHLDMVGRLRKQAEKMELTGEEELLKILVTFSSSKEGNDMKTFESVHT